MLNNRIFNLFCLIFMSTSSILVWDEAVDFLETSLVKVSVSLHLKTKMLCVCMTCNKEHLEVCFLFFAETISIEQSQFSFFFFFLNFRYTVEPEFQSWTILWTNTDIFWFHLNLLLFYPIKTEYCKHTKLNVLFKKIMKTNKI